MSPSKRRIAAAISFLALATLMVTPNKTASAQEFAYVANSSGSSVTIINTIDLSVLQTFDVGFSLHGIALHPNGRFLYVVYQGFVGVYETTGYTRVALVQVGSGSWGIALSPDGAFAYVTNIQANSVSVMETETNTVVATVPVLTSPTGVAVTPDGEWVYVSNSDTRKVSIIETQRNTVAGTVDVGVSPDALAVSPDGARVYVPNNSENSISVIETAGNMVSHTLGLDGGPTAVALSSNGEYLYAVAEESTTLTIFDAGPDTVLATVDVGAANHRGLAVTPNGRYVYVPNLGTSTVSIVDFGSGGRRRRGTTSDTTVTMVEVGTSPWTVAIGMRVDVTANEPLSVPDARLLVISSFPNPFSESAQITYTVSKPGTTSFQIIDVTGRTVRDLETGWSNAGEHRLYWDGRNDVGSSVPPGLYLFRLQVGDFVRALPVIKASGFGR